MRYLGIDLGSKKTGIAHSDKGAGYAFPYKVIKTNKYLAKNIIVIAKELGADIIVIGHSINKKCEENPIAKDGHILKEQLEKNGYEVYFEPEWYTTKQAERIEDKGDVDARAAALILQSFLDKALAEKGNKIVNKKNTFRLWVLQHADSKQGYFIILVLSFFEAIIFPIPVEFFIVPLTFIKPKSWLMYSILGTVGTTVGGLVSYGIGTLFFDYLPDSITNITAECNASKQDVFGTTFFASFTPFPFKLFMMWAGSQAFPILIVIIASLVGHFLRYALLTYAAKTYREKAVKYLGTKSTFKLTLSTIAFVLLLLIVFIVIYEC